MNERYRLIDLMMCVRCKAECCSARDGDRCSALDDLDRCQIETIADHLLENGVIVPPCKSGQTVYELTTSEEIKRRKIKDIIYDNGGFRLRLEPYCSYEYYLNETVFLTPEEAKKELKERSEKQ